MPRTLAPRGPVQLLQPEPIRDPLQSLSGLMSLAGQIRGYQDNERARGERQAVDEAMASGQGDFGRAAGALEEKGQWRLATGLRDEQRKRTEETLSQLNTRLSQAKTPFGLGAQILQEAKAKPELWSTLRPRLLDVAASVDPKLAAHVPEQYDEAAVETLLGSVEDTVVSLDERQKALKTIAEAGAIRDDRIKQDDLYRKALRGWFRSVGSEEEWAQTKDYAVQQMRIPPHVVEEVVGPWSPEAPERVRRSGMTDAEIRQEDMPSTMAGALLKARRENKPEDVKELLALQRQLTEASTRRTATTGAAAAVTPETLSSVLKYPGLWGELTPTVRTALIPGLSRAGFDFGAAAEAITPGARRQIEQWRTSQLSDLNEALREDELTDAEHEAEVARIEESYRVQLGSGGAPRSPAGRSDGAAARSRDTVLPPDKRTAQPPASAAATGTDKAVAEFLSGKTPGVYDLGKDGKWRLKRDGTVEAAR